MIEFRDVRASYERSLPILKGVSFTIGDREFVAFVGTNGAGKSTAMRLMNGLLKPDAGEVVIDGAPTTALKTSELARRVGFLFQNPDRQICCPTVREELLFGFKALGIADADAEARVDAIIGEFGFAPDDDPFLLNRGARQLLALASVAVLEPPVLVLDEPTTGLDFRECEKVMGIVRGIHERGVTVVMVCHDMEVVADYAKRCIVMSDGRVAADGPVFEVLRDRTVLERASLVPPQIVDISLTLAQESSRLAGTAVARANTVDEMAAAVAAVAGGAVAGAAGDAVGDAVGGTVGAGVAVAGAGEIATAGEDADGAMAAGEVGASAAGGALVADGVEGAVSDGIANAPGGVAGVAEAGEVEGAVRTAVAGSCDGRPAHVA